MIKERKKQRKYEKIGNKKRKEEEMKKIEWIAHRGGIPENTRDAILQSLSQSEVDGVEVDLRFSCDGYPMIYHDETLERLFQRATFVSHLSQKELQETYHLLSLKELLELWKESSKLLILEIKSRPSEIEMKSTKKRGYSCLYV